jgi:hypothetical protein
MFECTQNVSCLGDRETKQLKKSARQLKAGGLAVLASELPGFMVYESA